MPTSRSLPVNLQHELDGGLYISAGIDYAKDPANGWTNIGCRRLMLRGPRAAGIDLNAPSDLRAIYLAAVGARRETAGRVHRRLASGGFSRGDGGGAADG